MHCCCVALELHKVKGQVIKEAQKMRSLSICVFCGSRSGHNSAYEKAAEVLFLSPIALCILAYYHGWIGGHFGGDGWTSFLLTLSGPLTATPLILFSYAARRIKLSTVGILQYINPSLQFICATLILLEPLTMWHAITFPMIWIALVIYSVVSLYSRRA